MRRCGMLGVVSVLVVVGAVCAQDKPLSVSDLRADIPTDYRNAAIGVRLIGIRSVDAAKGDLVALLKWRDGAWATNGNVVAADYNETSANRIEIESGTFDGKTLQASLVVKIGPDGARRGRRAFPTPPDEFRVRVVGTVRSGEPLPWEPDREAFMPPWRKDVPTFGGQLIEGTYEGEWVWKNVTNSVKGALRGGVNHEPVAGWWGVRGNAHIGPASGGGMHFLARLPTRVVADGGEAWAVRIFSAPSDWRGFDTVRVTVECEARRNDAMLAVQVVDAAGRRARVLDAAPIAAGRNVSEIAFADFAAGMGAPDWSKIVGIELGVADRGGVGDVRCKIESFQVVRTGKVRPANAGVTIEVKPEFASVLNGADDIPKGLFGVHAVGAVEKPVKTFEDQPDADAYMLRLRPGLFRKVEHTGFGGKPMSDEEAARRIKERPNRAVEPTGAEYRRLKAGDGLDNLIICHTMDLWDRPPWLNQGLEGLSNAVRVCYRNMAAGAWVPGDDFNSVRKFEVWNEPFMWGRHINMGFRVPPGCRDVTDDTQYGYLPGRVGADAWSTLFLAAWEGAKQVNPHVLLGGPSAPAFGDDDYRMFSNYVARILDRVGDKIDFLTEHHYGGDPRTVAAGYEVATAWCDIQYGRRIPIYNTEANDLGASDAGKAAYNILDILTCATVCPDKARGRSIHALWNGYLNNRGEEHAWMLMSPLRGRRVVASSTDPDVVCAASCPESGKLVIVVMNAAAGERTVRLAPLSLGIREGQLLLGKRPERELQLRDVDGAFVPAPPEGGTVLRSLDVSAIGKGEPVTIVLPPGCAVQWTFLQQNYEPKEECRIEQHFTTALLAHVEPERPVDAVVKFKGSVAGVKRAWVRMVAGGLQESEGMMEIGATAVPLPADRRRDGNVLIREVPIDASLVKTGMKIRFSCAHPEKDNGFHVYAASVMTEF